MSLAMTLVRTPSICPEHASYPTVIPPESPIHSRFGGPSDGLLTLWAGYSPDGPLPIRRERAAPRAAPRSSEMEQGAGPP